MIIDATTKTFIHHAQTLVKVKGEEVFATWYDNKGKPTEDYTFGRLWDEAGIIAHNLRKTWGLQKGDRVVLCYDFGLHFFSVFLGCIRAGVVAVLVYPPAPPLTKSLPKLVSVVDTCSPMLILTDSKIHSLKRLDELNLTSSSRSSWPKSVQFKVTDALPLQTTSHAVGGWLNRVGRSWSSSSDSKVPCFDELQIKPEDTAFLQFTSGSTSTPKGVVVTHHNLVANARSFLRAFHKYGPSDGKFVGCSWLPQYHDMGLLCATIYPFCGGWRQHVMSPITFIQNPLIWLNILSDAKANWSMVPDFSYRLVTRKFLEHQQRLGRGDIRMDPMLNNINLTNIWKLLSAAEPIHVDTKRQFEETFADYGLPKNWFGSGYGIAESVVAVSHGFDFRTSTKREEDASTFVAVGWRQTFDEDMPIKVVDPQTHKEVDDNTTGEVWLSGPSIAGGYYGQPNLSEQAFEVKLKPGDSPVFPSDSGDEVHLRTGDLGFFQNDNLFICGRIKDLIIINGANHYPQDIEFVVQEASSAVRPGCVAAFSTNESDSSGDLNIVFEIRKSAESNVSAVCEQVKEAIIQKVGLVPSTLLAIKERTICKTTSGKIQRRANRMKLLEGGHAIIHRLSNRAPLQASPQQHHQQKQCPLPSPSQSEPKTDQELYCAAILDVLGTSVDMDSKWEDNGLSSILIVELSNKISDQLEVSVPADFQRMYTTPSLLQDYVLKTRAGLFPTQLPNFQKAMLWDQALPWTLASVCQLLGGILLVLLIASSVIPAYYFVTSVGGEMAFLLPLVIPVWYLSLTFLVIATKWIVIGKYSTKEIAVPSVSYLQWWIVDRVVHTWEVWIGAFIKNTPIITIVYKLMGAKIDSSASIDAFIREFDLISIGKESSVSMPIRCRKFGPWDEASSGPTLRFRPTSVGNNCRVLGHLEPGVSLGDGSCAEKLSMVSEGSQVPTRAMAIGNPAHHSKEVASSENTIPSWKEIGLFKIGSLCLQLYLSTGLFAAADLAIPTHFLDSWRYGWLVRLLLVVVLQALLSMVTTIVVKWCLIGKRRPGPAKSSWGREVLDWFADYNYSISILLFETLGANSSVVNFFLMAMGMDIDLDSKVWAFMFPPSIVDLISVKSSFVSFTSFRTKLDGKYLSVRIDDSTIARDVFVEGGAVIAHESIQPKSFISTEHRSYSTRLGSAAGEQPLPIPWALLGRIWLDVFFIFHVCLLFLSFLPTIEMWKALQSTAARNGFTFWIILACTLVVQTVAMHGVMLLVQFVFFSKERRILRLGDWQIGFVPAFWSFVYTCEAWTFLHIFWGTAFYGFFLKILGANVEGKMLYFGDHVYDFPLVTFADRTIVDSAFVVCGHSGLRGKILMGETTVSGLLHPGCAVLANTQMLKPCAHETGPMTFVAPAVTDKNGTSDKPGELTCTCDEHIFVYEGFDLESQSCSDVVTG